MSGPGPSAPAHPAARLEVAAGGVPSPEQLAALAAALFEATRPVAAPADPLPAAYRSRWRRAAMREMAQVPVGIKDNGSAWGNTA